MKKICYALLFGAILFFSQGGEIEASNGVGIADNENGTVTVTYENEDESKIAVTVKKSGESNQYNYFVEQKDVEVSIPLTSGNGTYNICVLQHIEDNKYSPLTSEEIELELEDYKTAYLSSNEMIKWEEKNKAIKKANKIAKKYKSQMSKIKGIRAYLVKKFDYDYEKFAENESGNLSYYMPDINETFRTKKGICYDISALTASMMRSVGIQTKMVTGYPCNDYFDGVSYHAWNKVFSKKYKKWLVLDVTCDICLYDQGVEFGKIPLKKKGSQYSNVKYEY